MQVTGGQRVLGTKAAIARELRRQGTAAERAAWRLLRNRGLLGLKFRRQQVVAGFVVDFYCAEHGIALEVDGGVHDDPEHRTADAERQRVLDALGIRTIRVSNDDVNEASLRAAFSSTLNLPLSIHAEGERA